MPKAVLRLLHQLPHHHPHPLLRVAFGFGAAFAAGGAPPPPPEPADAAGSAVGVVVAAGTVLATAAWTVAKSGWGPCSPARIAPPPAVDPKHPRLKKSSEISIF